MTTTTGKKKLADAFAQLVEVEENLQPSIESHVVLVVARIMTGGRYATTNRFLDECWKAFFEWQFWVRISLADLSACGLRNRSQLIYEL